MTSKQQPARPTQNMSSSSSKSTPRTLIFTNIFCEGEKYELVEDLRRNYRGIKNAIQIYYQGNNGESIHGVRIDVNSDNFADQFLGKKQIRIYDAEHSIQSLSPKSIIVTKVPASEKPEKILQDLSHNYLNIAKVSRFYDIHGVATDNIVIDFKSDASSAKIFKDDYILIDGKRRSIQPYWSLVHIPNENETEVLHSSEQIEKSTPQQPQKFVPREHQKSAPKQSQMYLTERRVKELFREQQMQLEAMINEFENKWNARLSSLTTTSSNSNVEQLVPIMKDLAMVTQQFNQQNAQLQRQLGSVVHQIQDVQFKLNNEQGQSSWPKLPTQNGH